DAHCRLDHDKVESPDDAHGQQDRQLAGSQRRAPWFFAAAPTALRRTLSAHQTICSVVDIAGDGRTLG
ncbi:MAG: hypothetical protein ACX939_12580, partial [Hyphococcus sp.]